MSRAQAKEAREGPDEPCLNLNAPKRLEGFTSA
jgi:hypothetical protein